MKSSSEVHRGRDVIADPQMSGSWLSSSIDGILEDLPPHLRHEQPGLVCMDFGHLCHEACTPMLSTRALYLSFADRLRHRGPNG